VKEQAKQKNPRISKLDFFFGKKVGKTITAYGMIEEGDKILVGVSGRKSSLSLLKVLRYKQGRLPIRFEIVACYVNRGASKKASKIVEKFFKQNGCDYLIKEGHNKGEDLQQALAKIAKTKGCNKIALGHNQDDVAHALLFNIFFNGRVASMDPKQQDSKESPCIIRPLYQCEEKFITRYSNGLSLPQFKEDRLETEDSKELLIKNLLHDVYDLNKSVKINISRSLSNINCDYLPSAAYGK